MNCVDSCQLFRLHVREENNCNFSLNDLSGETYYPWEYETCSETGFLLGDPFCSPSKRGSFRLRPELAFLLNKKSLLRVSSGSSVIEMLHPDELTKDRDGFLRTAVREW